MHKTIYLDALKTYRLRLDEIENKLFVAKDDDVNVPFRDLIGLGPGFCTYPAIEVHGLIPFSVR